MFSRCSVFSMELCKSDDPSATQWAGVKSERFVTVTPVETSKFSCLSLHPDCLGSYESGTYLVRGSRLAGPRSKVVRIGDSVSTSVHVVSRLGSTATRTFVCFDPRRRSNHPKELVATKLPCSRRATCREDILRVTLPMSMYTGNTILDSARGLSTLEAAYKVLASGLNALNWN